MSWTMPSSQPFDSYCIYLEEEVAPDEWRQDEYILSDLGFTPADPGNPWGPIEHCCPPSDASAEFCTVHYRKDCEGEPVEVSRTCFLERYVACNRFAHSIEEAERMVTDELLEAAGNWEQDAYEAAMDSKYDAWRDDRMTGDR